LPIANLPLALGLSDSEADFLELAIIFASSFASSDDANLCDELRL